MKFIYSKAFAAFAVCLIIVALFLFLQVKGFFGPIRSVFLAVPRPFIALGRGVAVPAKNLVVTIFTLKRIAQENSQLNARVIDLEQNTVLLNQYKLENDSLKKELGFLKNTSFQLQPCSVLAVDPQQLTATMVIACGQGQGLQEGQAVIAQGFLVGKLVAVGSSTSTVLLITHTKSSVDARISKNSVEALVRGSSGAGLILDLVPPDTQLQPGDLIVTAGISTIIPRNILIGEVGQVLSQQSDLFKRASIISPIRFQDLQFVFVVKQ
jgi:rod shape-determining protein MreC